MKNYDNISTCVLDSQSAAGASLALFSALNEKQRVLFLQRELSRLENTTGSVGCPKECETLFQLRNPFVVLE